MGNKIVSTSEIIDLVPMIVGCLSDDKVSLGKIADVIAKETFTTIQKIPYYKIKHYIHLLYDSNKSLCDVVKLNAKLFGDPNKRDDNALLVLTCLTESDTVSKLDWIANATVACSYQEELTAEDFFRILTAIDNTLQADLCYLSSIIEKNGPFQGEMHILGLARTGLMISAGIDANADVEKQNYEITSLGYMVDRYAISYYDETRQKWYKNKRDEFKTPSMPGETWQSFENGTLVFHDGR